MRAATLLLASLALAGCGSSTAGDAGVDVVTPSDTPADTSTDTATDVSTDTPTDVSTDTPTDTARDAGPDSEPFCDVPGTYTFRHDGGLAPYSESSRIEPGRQFTYTRTEAGSDAGARTCTTMLDYCGAVPSGVVDTLTVINALNHADVTAAFADQTATLYGRDTRPVDGQVFVVTRGDGRHFEVGSDCGGAAGCRAIPAGLARLRVVLTDLQTQQLARPACAGVRP